MLDNGKNISLSWKLCNIIPLTTLHIKLGLGNSLARAASTPLT